MVSALERRRPGRPPSVELNERRRQEIIVCALRLFAERGYRATTMDDIAGALGCTKGLIYHYFNSKAELAEQADTGAHELIERGVAEIVGSSLPPVEKLERAVTHFITEILLGYQRYLVILWDRAEMRADQGEAHRASHLASRRRIFLLYRSIIIEGIEAGVFVPGDPSLMAYAVIQGISSVARWYRPEGRIGAEQIRQEMSAMLVRMVHQPAPITLV